MRKTLRGVGILAVLVVLGAPAVVGMVAEHKQRRFIDAGAGPSAALVAYDRGWFGSTSVIEYPLGGPAASGLVQALGYEPATRASLRVDSEIRHGPIAGIGSGGLSIAKARSRLTLTLGDDILPLPGDVHGRLHPGGRLDAKYRSGPGVLTGRDDTAIRWLSAELGAVLNGTGRLTLAGQWDGVTAHRARRVVALGPLALHGDYHRAPRGFWAGTSRIDAQTLVASNGGDSLSAREVTLQSDQRLAGARINYRLALSAASIGGKGWEGADAQIRLRVDGVDSTALNGILAGTAPGPLTTGLSGIRRVLGPGAAVFLETMNIPTAYGAVVADFGIRLPETDADADADTHDIAYLLSLEGQGRLEMPRRLAMVLSRQDERFRDMLQQLLRLRLLKSSGGAYRLEAAYAGGLLTINGFPVPLPFVAQ